MKWYAVETRNLHYQGLVIEEGTGRNIAVSYEGKDAILLAAAPDMLEALEAIKVFAPDTATHIHAICDAAIEKARGG